MTDNRLTQFNVADAGLIIKNTSTGDNKPSILSLESNEAAVETGETVGSLNFKVSGEEGGDSIEVCAGIDAVAEADFTTSVNSTKLSFKTGSSEAAAEKMALSSNGNLQLVGAESSIKINERSSAPDHTADYGKIWIKNETPNQLWFTNDAGNDIQITDGSGLVGGSSASLNDLSDVLVENNSIFLGSNPSSTTSSAQHNISIGKNCLDSITTGDRNTCMGFEAGTAITEGNDNTVIGYRALYTATTHSGNTAVGSESLKVNTANNNTALGYRSGYSNTDGTNNVFIGTESGYSNTTGDQNTFCGYQAGYSNQTSDNIVLLGWHAGYDVTGANNTVIGYQAGNTGTNDLTTGTNNIIIGYQAAASGATVTNEITLGNSNISALRCEVDLTALSDKRDKDDIIESKYGIDFIDKLNPVEFTWKTRDGNIKDGKTRVGFLAQDFLEAMPNNENEILDLVYESNPERLEAKYGNLIPVIVKAIQDISKENDNIINKFNNLFN